MRCVQRLVPESFRSRMLFFGVVVFLAFSASVYGDELKQRERDTRTANQTEAVTASVTNKPFFMIVIGDSIAQGVGLLEPEKFSSRVTQSIAKAMRGRRQIVKITCARVGAKIGNNTDRGEGLCDPGIQYHKRASVPTVKQQVDMAVNTLRKQHGVGPEDVELVLMTGGFNDVGVSAILDPTVGVDALRNKTRDIFQAGLMGNEGLMAKTAAIFPQAKIIYAGYYKIVSDASTVDALLDIFPFNLPKAPGDVARLKPRLVEQSTAFFEESNR